MVRTAGSAVVSDRRSTRLAPGVGPAGECVGAVSRDLGGARAGTCGSVLFRQASQPFHRRAWWVASRAGAICRCEAGGVSVLVWSVWKAGVGRRAAAI